MTDYPDIDAKEISRVLSNIERTVRRERIKDWVIVGMGIVILALLWYAVGVGLMLGITGWVLGVGFLALALGKRR